MWDKPKFNSTAGDKDTMSAEEEKHENQLCLLKKQVKALMEEAVTKKFIHEESPRVLQLCATVEQCLLDGVKRRTTGFLRPNKLANLYTKVGKSIATVLDLVKQIEEIESKQERSIFDEHLNRMSFSSAFSTHQNGTRRNGKHLWVRMALTSKLLDRIVDFLVQNNSKFYHFNSIMADPVRGKILATLLVGPCALDYTKLKTQDHYWSDPPADELLQRHKLHSRAKTNSSKRPALNCSSYRPTSSSDLSDSSSVFRDYIESLHQNSKISLLYGKNNVTIQPEEVGPIPGYLSLHQEEQRIMIKWTPNHLMHEENDRVIETGEQGTKKDGADIRQNGHVHGDVRARQDLNSFMKYVISVDLRDIVYLHCHHQGDKGGTLVLIGQDGVQWPPIVFPPGGHLLSFLTCLENGLRPLGYLDPPLWLQKGKGKVFPRLRRKSRRSESSSDSDDFTDFVFRVVFTSDSSNKLSSKSAVSRRRHANDVNLLQPITNLPALWSKTFSNSTAKPLLSVNDHKAAEQSVVFRRGLNPRSLVFHHGLVQPQRKPSENGSSNGVFESSEEYVPHLDMYTWDQSHPRHYNEPQEGSSYPASAFQPVSSLKTLCSSMNRQILSRAFQGWLAYCRRLMAVRTHLTALVNTDIVSAECPSDASIGVTDEIWQKLAPGEKLMDLSELARYVYFGGVKSPRLRPLIWLYLLGHYPPGSGEEDRRILDQECIQQYQKIRAEDEEIKKKYFGSTAMPFSGYTSSLSNSDRLSWSSSYVPAPFLKQTSSTVSDVFLSGYESAPVQDKSESSFEFRKSIKKNRSLKEKRKRLHKRSRSDESNVPYSSISTTATSQDCISSFSIKSISLNDDYDGLKPLKEESEKSSTCELSPVPSSIVEDHTPGDGREEKCQNQQASISWTNKFDSIDPISLNLTQIEKDVHRCDRNHEYFTHQHNLVKLSNVMSCFVWKNPEIGYVQGMCDLAAPLLILFDDESVVFSCFSLLMKRITFQKGNEMDTRLANLRSLIQALDSELFEHLHTKNDQLPFFFCYRWFLLEFKRELSYDDDVFAVWECSWAARTCSSPDFGLFFALAMLENYRDVIIENDMDYSAIVKFFNEMAEKHNAQDLLALTRKLISDVQHMIHK